MTLYKSTELYDLIKPEVERHISAQGEFKEILEFRNRLKITLAWGPQNRVVVEQDGSEIQYSDPESLWKRIEPILSKSFRFCDQEVSSVVITIVPLVITIVPLKDGYLYQMDVSQYAEIFS